MVTETSKSLSETARDFFHLLEAFGKTKNIKKFVNVWLLEDPVQQMETTTCGAFQLYFFENLFFPAELTKLHSYQKLTNIAIETILDELFTLDKQKKQTNNKRLHKKTTNNNTLTYTNCPAQNNNLSLSKIVGFGQAQAV